MNFKATGRGWGGCVCVVRLGVLVAEEGNDILVTENLLSINLLRRITMIDLCKKTSYLPITGLDHV